MAENAQAPPPVDIGALLAQELASLGGAGAPKAEDYLGLVPNSMDNETGAYVDPIREPGPGMTKRPPIYKPGAQNMPIMGNWNKDDITSLQDQLVAAGVLDKDFVRGYWDGPSAQAFAEILGEANNMGTHDYGLAIQGRINAMPMEIDPKTGKPRRKLSTSSRDASSRAPLSMALSNSNDLADTAQEIAQKRIGRTFTTDELNRFVSSYHNTERGVQTADYANQNPDGSGGTVMQGQSATGAANSFAEQVDPIAAEARNMLPMVESINKLLNVEDTVQPLQGGF